MAQPEPGLKKVADGLAFPEGPAYDGRGNVIVSSCQGPYLTKIAADGKVSVYLRPTSGDDPWTFRKPNGATFYRDGSQFVCDFGRSAVVRIFPGGEQEVYADATPEGQPFRGPNDLAFDPKGNLYFTDPAGSSKNNPIGCVYRIARGSRKVTRAAGGLAFPNGLAFSSDARTLFVCESQRNHVLRFRVGGDGSLENKQIAADLSVNGAGEPDGMAVDQAGNLVVAHFGGQAVLVFNPDGKLGRTIRLPGKRVTNVEYAGRDLRTLFVTETETNAAYTLAMETPGLALFCAPPNTGTT